MLNLPLTANDLADLLHGRTQPLVFSINRLTFLASAAVTVPYLLLASAAGAVATVAPTKATTAANAARRGSKSSYQVS